VYEEQHQEHYSHSIVPNSGFEWHCCVDVLATLADVGFAQLPAEKKIKEINLTRIGSASTILWRNILD
jgi:hypothetical protein